MDIGHDRSTLRWPCGPSWLAVSALLTVACLAPIPVQAGVAANQLCGMARLGAGCIGTFRPGGIGAGGVRPNVGGAVRGMGMRPNVGGMMGGIMGTIMGIVVEQMVDQMIQSAAEGAAGQESASNAADPVQDAVERQVRFQQDRDRQLLALMADVSANQLADGSSNMGLLEPQAYQESLGFDRPLEVSGDTLWMRVQDPWYSPEAPVPGGRPLALAENRLQYSPKDSDALRCTRTMGGELCGFPGSKAPALTVQPIAMSPSSPAPLTSIPSPGPGPVPVSGNVSPLLRTDIPSAMASTWRLPESESAASEPPCSADIGFEAPDNLMAVARSEDPQTAGGAYILNFTVGKLQGVLGQVQGKIASVTTGAYRAYVRRLLCRSLALLASAPQDIALGRGDSLAQVDEIQKRAGRELTEDLLKEYFSELKGMLKEKVDDFHGELKADARAAAEDALSGRPGPQLDRDIGPYADTVRHRSAWDYPGRLRHWMEKSPHDHLLPEGSNAGGLKE